MTASAPTVSRELIYIPDVASTRFYLGALAKLSVLQYFVAEAAVIGAWAGREPYSRRTGYISDLGALGCGGFSGRDVCSPAHLLMNASFVVQGIGMMVGALLLSSAVIGIAARAGTRLAVAPGRRSPSAAAFAARSLSLTAGAGTVIVGLVPEDAGSGWHWPARSCTSPQVAWPSCWSAGSGADRHRWAGSSLPAAPSRWPRSSPAERPGCGCRNPARWNG